ncbi:nitrilase and fragile histidine triad fusion protein NitFhit-like [Pollicipes pollicipes]|uniref:nitrilase and fragile histidine triad fusion protein NitFhit-like n=1 Tax=Pollicipes pollicipes TaxID=41117 RepID=UPI0018854C12|nr:nitrilase and fragile histidine triad fusion protein NitFhit-like [Pollicipes pollicipes]
MLTRLLAPLRTIAVRPMATASDACRVAALQVTCTADKAANLQLCSRLVEEAAGGGARLVFLPEACDFIGESREQTLALAEPRDGTTVVAYQDLARRLGVWLSLGGVHERTAAGRCLNTHLLVSADGEIAASYSKAHLFDVDVVGTAPLRESQYVAPGGALEAPAPTPAGRLALLICYDLRFAEHSQLMRRQGAELLSYPSVFTKATGHAHWEPLLRARAIETQCHVVAAAQVGQHNVRRSSYGHALIVDPWGRVLADAGEKANCVVYGDISAAEVARVRAAMPVVSHRRNDLYPDLVPVPRLPTEAASAIFSATTVFPGSEEKFRFGQVTIDGDMVVYRTELSYAFVNKKCVVPGHMLVSPQRDVPRLGQLTPAEVADLFQVSQLVQRLVEHVHEASSATICVQDGPAAGQTIQHVHVHVLPRKPGDFAFNDEVYGALADHDKGQPQWRDAHEMRRECRVLRAELLRMGRG